MEAADPLAATLDEGIVTGEIDREATPLEHAIDEVTNAADVVNAAASRIERAAIGDGIRHDARAAELDALPGAVWARAVDASIADIRRIIAKPSRWALVRRVTAGVGIGAVAAILGLAARALIAHGSSSALGAAQVEAVRRHEIEIRQLQRQQAADDESHGRRTGP